MRLSKSLIVLVRHGETGHNRHGVVQGQGDVPLSEHGLEQARDLAPALRGLEFHSAFVSPLSRAVRTWEQLEPTVGLKPRLDQRLIEQNYGDWEGRSYVELWEADPQGMLGFLNDPYNFEIPNGERMPAMEQRVGDFVERCLPDAAEQRNVLVVAHGGSLRLILCRLLGLDVSRHFFSLDLANCSISAVLRIPGRSVLHCLNWRPEPFERLMID